MENRAKVVFLIQMLQTFGGRYNRYFRDIRLKILRLANFNMLFQLVLTKFFKSELFSCLKVDYVIKSCKEPRKKQSKGKRLKKTVSLLDSVYFKGILLPGTRWIRHWKRKQSKGCRP